MTDDDELKRRNRQLAKDILETLDAPPDPDRIAYDEQKEREDKAALADYYKRTGQSSDKVPKARSATEMMFAASLEPCAKCKTWEAPDWDLIGGGTAWSVAGDCPRCRTRRSYAWDTEGHPNEATVLPEQLGDERPSQIIRPGQLLAEIDRLTPLVREPGRLSPLEWRASLSALERLLVCLHELVKFAPSGLIPDTILTEDERKDRAARRERYRKAWMQSELDHVEGMLKKYSADAPRIFALEKLAAPAPAIGRIDRAALDDHATWLRGQGGRRLEVTGFDARGLRLAGVLLDRARLERVDLSTAVLDAAQLTGAELLDVTARDAVLTSVDFTRARLDGGAFGRARLALAVFKDTTIDETAFDEASLDRTEWAGAQVTAASFDRASLGNAWLDRGTFRGCTFRRADLRLVTEGIRATTAGAVFEDCDLRFTRWDGRDLSGARFVRCKLHGITGRPSSTANVAIVDPDLSVDGDGSDLGDADDVLALWQ